MADGSKEEYEDAIRELNGLYRSKRLMEKVKQNRKLFTLQQLPDLHKLFEELSITQADIDKLRVIHVTGTKGKGSTCAYIESILRHHGYKPLLFSSPHVKEIRERISLNGSPLSYKSFAAYFWEIYHQLKHLKNEDNNLVHFYNFISLMGIYVAMKESQLGNIDAIVMEGMLGGEYDYINILGNKAVCGVTSLGLEHTTILGETIEEIAWHKGGIFRKGAPAFTSPQPEEAMAVLKERATERETVLSLCPPLDRFGSDIELGIGGDAQKLNASLALQMVREWIKQHKQHDSPLNNEMGANTTPANSAELQPITEKEREGLKNCHSIGKDHVVKLDDMTFYLDGAHTLESLQNSRTWYEQRSHEEAVNIGRPIQRILVFAISPDRNISRLLSPMKGYPFDIVLFLPYVTDGTVETSLDHQLVVPSIDQQIESAKLTKKIWDDEIAKSAIKDGVPKSVYCTSIVESFKWLTEYRVRAMQHNRPTLFQILVTGSNFLLGKYLKVLDSVIDGTA